RASARATRAAPTRAGVWAEDRRGGPKPAVRVWAARGGVSLPLRPLLLPGAVVRDQLLHLLAKLPRVYRLRGLLELGANRLRLLGELAHHLLRRLDHLDARLLERDQRLGVVFANLLEQLHLEVLRVVEQDLLQIRRQLVEVLLHHHGGADRLRD